MPDIIKLRPHHFLCMLTYIGKGYSRNFTENFDRIAERISQGTVTAELVTGQDDICAPRLCDPDDTTCHCLDERHKLIDDYALKDLKTLPFLKTMDVGNKIHLTPSLIAELRHHYLSGNIRTACESCEWLDLCNEIAKNDFKDTKLK